MNTEEAPIMQRPGRGPLRIFRFILILVLCVVAGVAAWFFKIAPTPPADFPVNVEIVVEEGMTLRAIGERFEEQNLVRSSFYLYIALLRVSENPVIQAGSYRFPEALNAHDIAHAVTFGEFQSPLVRVTFPEGFLIRDFRTYYPENYSPATEEELPIEQEGFLFPDTYYIRPDTPESELFALMRENFDARLAPYDDAIAASPFTRGEVIILASIIEREARDLESKKRVSGILQNRLEINMPLQVDATFDYLLDKTSAELTMDDLALDSPFNTYLYRGLPPAPIANPGLESIEAVLKPEENDYFFYLTADDGTFYYAETLDGHRENRRLYLD